MFVAAVAANGPATGERMICVAVSCVSRATPAPRATRSRSAFISSALWYRSPGSFASARMTTMSSSGGMSCRFVDGAAGTCDRCFIAISTGVSPEKGTTPVSISYMSTPTE